MAIFHCYVSSPEGTTLRYPRCIPRFSDRPTYQAAEASRLRLGPSAPSSPGPGRPASRPQIQVFSRTFRGFRSQKNYGHRFFDGKYPPVNIQKLLKMAVEIVDFPMNNGDFPWQNVSSPEGT